ncbi:MAG: VWA domain-containing protein [Candidatus Acidiferrales bacterium]
MSINVRCYFLLAVLILAPAAVAQQANRPAQPADNSIYLDVVVTHKSGTPISGLQEQEFTLLDNNVSQKITSFQAVDGDKAPIEVIVLIDTVNAPYQAIVFARNQIDKVLVADGGDLAHPTTLAVLTDTGIQFQQGFSQDGNKLRAALDQYTLGLRSIRRSAGFYGAAERFQLSLEGLHQLVQREAPLPGRKIVLCVSPGWPLLSGPEVQLDGKKQQQLFGDIVDFSTDFLRDRITLYNVNPWGASESLEREDYWQSFLKGISKPGQVAPGDLGLQVLATQSGGLVLEANNDIAGLLQKCLADARTYYEISFQPPSDDRPGKYHRLQVRVSKSGLTARTTEGYYSRANADWSSPPTPLDSGDPVRR